jgi:hypothetical protein
MQSMRRGPEKADVQTGRREQRRPCGKRKIATRDRLASHGGRTIHDLGNDRSGTMRNHLSDRPKRAP